MSHRTSAEIKGIIEQVENEGFEDLRTKSRMRADQLYKRAPYLERLGAEIDEKITTKIPKPSDRPQISARQIQGIINNTLSFHVDGRNDVKNDKQELYFANLWEANFNKGGILRSNTHRNRVVGPFSAWVLEYKPFQLPSMDSERKEYRKNYQPFSLSVVDSRTVAFLRDAQGDPTLSTRSFRLPYVDIAQIYGDNAKDDHPAVVIGEQFAFLRVGKDVDEDAVFTGKSAMVYVIDDGNKIGHYTEISGEYHQLNNPSETNRDIPNPFGRNSMYIINGIYNDDAETVDDAYQGLVWPMMGEQHNVDVMETHLASIVFTMSKYGQIIPPEVAQAAIIEDKAIPSADLGGKNVAALYGQVAELKIQASSEARYLLERQLAERDSALPPPFLTNPDVSLVKDAAATSLLAANETSNKEFDDTRGSEKRNIVEVNNAIKHFFRGGHAAFAEEEVFFTLSGREKVTTTRGKSVASRKDEHMSIKADDFEDGDVMEVNIVAATESQKALQYQLKQAQVTDGTATHRDLVATTTEDVSGKIAELNEEKFFQQGRQAFMSAVILMAVQLILAETGEDLSPLFLGEGGGGGQGTPPDDGLRAPANQVGQNMMATPAVGTGGATG
jgi:hypothetical protein